MAMEFSILAILTFYVIFKGFAFWIGFKSMEDEVPIDDRLHGRWLADGLNIVANVLFLVSAILMIVCQW